MQRRGAKAKSRSGSVSFLRAVGGLVIGGYLMWLALRHISTDEILVLTRRLQMSWVAVGVGFYWADLVLRTERWRALLEGLANVPANNPGRYTRLGEVLLVGYAVNNILPARLGELFRADYAGRRLALPPATVFGTIIIERLLDGIIVAVGLCIGLAVLFGEDAVAPGYREPLMIIAFCGAGIITAAVTGIFAATHYPHAIDWLPNAARRVFVDLFRGIECFRTGVASYVVLITLMIWLLEGAAIWCLTNASGIELGWWASVVLVSALSLGTLVPTAPAYIGSYQLIFGLCLASFGLPAAAGVLNATMVQVFLLAPVTIGGLLIYSVTQFTGVMRTANG